MASLFPGVIFATQLHGWRSKTGSSCSFAVPMSSQLPIRHSDVQRLQSQSEEEFQRREHPIYFKGQIDSRKNYRARVWTGLAIERLTAMETDLSGGSMFIATPYEHPNASNEAGRIVQHHVTGLSICRCPQYHGRVTLPDIYDSNNCVNCVESNSGQPKSLGIAERLYVNSEFMPCSFFVLRNNV